MAWEGGFLTPLRDSFNVQQTTPFNVQQTTFNVLRSTVLDAPGEAEAQEVVDVGVAEADAHAGIELQVVVC